MGLGLDWWKGALCERLVYVGPVRVSADQVLEVVYVSELGARTQGRVLHGVEAVFQVTAVSFDDVSVVLGCFLGSFVAELVLCWRLFLQLGGCYKNSAQHWSWGLIKVWWLEDSGKEFVHVVGQPGFGILRAGGHCNVGGGTCWRFCWLAPC